MKETFEFKCSYCGVDACTSEEEKKQPNYCPMPASDDILSHIKEDYLADENIHTLALESAKGEAAGYCKWTRVEETVNFAKKLGVTTIGIAHCAGLKKEAKVVHQIFSNEGFKVHSVCCKVGRIEKEALGIKDEEKVHPGEFESACNPIAQAKILADAGCGLNVVIGLCVGHDSLFFMHAQAPTTVLIAKDRVLGHNPVAALYTSHTYYRRLVK